jgi:hypothetical protein
MHRPSSLHSSRTEYGLGRPLATWLQASEPPLHRPERACRTVVVEVARSHAVLRVERTRLSAAEVATAAARCADDHFGVDAAAALAGALGEGFWADRARA